MEVKERVTIENPRRYDCGAIEHLRQLLESGSPLQRDMRREYFYEIEGAGETYYFHVSPVSGHVVLLARWIRQSQECCVSSGHLAG